MLCNSSWTKRKLQRNGEFDCAYSLFMRAMHVSPPCLCLTTVVGYNIILMRKSYTKRNANYAICTRCTLYTHAHAHVWIKSIFDEQPLRHTHSTKNRKRNDTTGENTKRRSNNERRENVVHNTEWRTQILIQRQTISRTLTVHLHKHARALTYTYFPFYQWNELNISEKKFHRT